MFKKIMMFSLLLVVGITENAFADKGDVFENMWNNSVQEDRKRSMEHFEVIGSIINEENIKNDKDSLFISSEVVTQDGYFKIVTEYRKVDGKVISIMIINHYLDDEVFYFTEEDLDNLDITKEKFLEELRKR